MRKYSYLLALAGLGLALGGCSAGGTCDNCGVIDNHPGIVNAVTIDNTGIVPVIGNGTTSSVFYVHNYSNVPINGITYTAQNNVNGSTQALSVAGHAATAAATVPFLDPTSVALCSSIPANSVCTMKFTTQALTGAASQGSALVKASYPADGVTVTFNSIISYAKVYNNPESGALFYSGVQVDGFGHNTGYATAYLYGSGTGQTYNIASILSDRPAVTIINGDITGQQLQSGFVQAVEISSPTAITAAGANVKPAAVNAGFTATLTTTSNAGATSYVNTTNVSVAAKASGANLNTGLVPLLDSGAANPGGSLYVTNSGNESALITAVVPTTGITPVLDGCSGKTLSAGGGCTITFSVPVLSNGQGTITLSYTGGTSPSVAGSISWYDVSGGGPLLLLQASVNPVIFNAGGNATTTIAVTNVGGSSFTNISAQAPVTLTGSATASVSNDTCSSNSLAIGQTCTYQVTVADSKADMNAQLSLPVQGTYASGGGSATYNTALLLNYTANVSQAIILITPNPANMTIIGNNSNTQTQQLSISNNGTVPALITERGISANPAYMTVADGTPVCGNTLKAGESCAVVVTLGPTTTASLQSGTAQYSVTYTGNQVATESINYTVQSNSQALSLTNVAITGATGGDGVTAQTAYIYAGYNTAAKSVTLTYQNSGTNPVSISGIQDSNSVFAWSLESGSSCYLATALAVGATCTLVYDNVLSQNANGLSGSGGIGASYTENLTVPVFTFQDLVATTQQFQVQPPLQTPYSGTTLFVTGQQATLANTVTLQNKNTAFESMTITNLLANAAGYTAFSVTTKMENYFTSNTANCTGLSVSGSLKQVCSLAVADLPANCVVSTSESGSIIQQVCTLSPTDLTGTVTYQVDPQFAAESLAVSSLFSLSPGGQTVSMSPLAIVTPLY